MKSTIHLTAAFPAVLVILALTGCASRQDAQNRQHQADAATSTPTGASGGGSTGNQMSMMDMKTMCDKHNKMMSAKTPEEKKSMGTHMETMSPEMRQKHMTMMEKCN
ncbi:hypothetical protein RY831_02960 [Noviherbaspirillum sp. CPCC 100848]|uniref:Lipoprotein n=1 Tax=Noviherbaspirillum album TaxID=3080276 RepID=A0ABU6J382_9BURK|nr:hypothetical protein [Noviherbaspirillum sp. CPCC 100848]MEC4718096.1 hypothetical protein [Noviherbaspirillum sp. CPCC 100848]